MNAKLKEYEQPYFEMCCHLYVIIGSLKSMEDKIINTMVKEHDLSPEETRGFVERLIPARML